MVYALYTHSSFDNLYAFVLAKPLEDCPQFLAQFSKYDFTSFFGTQTKYGIYIPKLCVIGLFSSIAPFVRISRGCSSALSYDKGLFY